MSGKRTCCDSTCCKCSEAPSPKKFKRNKDSKLTKYASDSHDIKIDTPKDDASSVLNSDCHQPKPEDRLVELMRPLLEALECPVCLDVADVRFKVCRRGHLVCNKCVNKLPKCPVCRSTFTIYSPLCLKNVIELLKKNGIPELVEHRR